MQQSKTLKIILYRRSQYDDIVDDNHKGIKVSNLREQTFVVTMFALCGFHCNCLVSGQMHFEMGLVLAMAFSMLWQCLSCKNPINNNKARNNVKKVFNTK